MNKESNSSFSNLDDIEEDSSITERNETSSKILFKEFKVTSNLWIPASILGGFLFALNNFFIGKASLYGFYARMFVGVGNLIQQ